MKATLILHQKQVLLHKDEKRTAIFEFVIWDVGKSERYPDGVKYRIWLSENGSTLLGLDNHYPKGPHLHLKKIRNRLYFSRIEGITRRY